MKVFDGHPMDQIFTHVDPAGVTRHFNASAILRDLLKKKLIEHARYQEVELTADLVKHVEDNHGIEQDHIERISEADTLLPIMLACFDDGTQCCIDGNHRIVKRWRMGKTTIPAIWIDQKGWEPYLITDMEELFPIEVAVPFLDKVSARIQRK
jgi:hypothetical protein